jgi:hypothetical protein
VWPSLRLHMYHFVPGPLDIFLRSFTVLFRILFQFCDYFTCTLIIVFCYVFFIFRKACILLFLLMTVRFEDPGPGKTVLRV